MIILKDILLEDTSLVSITAGELFDKFKAKYQGKTIIVVDTETLGLRPNVDYIQLTEVAAMAIDGNSFDIIDKINFKANLRPDAQKVTTSPYSPEFKDFVKREKQSIKRGKKRGVKKKKHLKWRDMKINKDKFFTPKNALDLTRYDEPTSEFVDEKELLERFIKFVSQFNNVVLMAQNARFDIGFLAVRAKKYGLSFPKGIKVADTLSLTKNVLYALLETLKNSDDQEAKELRSKLVKVDKRGTERVSMSLGVLAKALGVEPSGWHNALADTEMTIKMLEKVVRFIEVRRNINIRDKLKKPKY